MILPYKDGTLGVVYTGHLELYTDFDQILHAIMAYWLKNDSLWIMEVGRFLQARTLGLSGGNLSEEAIELISVSRAKFKVGVYPGGTFAGCFSIHEFRMKAEKEVTSVIHDAAINKT
eukprot:Gb_28744 [translate_table: standard]